jgi:hypothetical protein
MQGIVFWIFFLRNYFKEIFWCWWCGFTTCWSCHAYLSGKHISFVLVNVVPWKIMPILSPPCLICFLADSKKLLQASFVCTCISPLGGAWEAAWSPCISSFSLDIISIRSYPTRSSAPLLFASGRQRFCHSESHDSCKWRIAIHVFLSLSLVDSISGNSSDDLRCALLTWFSFYKPNLLFYSPKIILPEVLTTCFVFKLIRFQKRKTRNIRFDKVSGSE